jgi:sugar O-acyltransferase (sialic acid O-acetyltransferase NeuD family)
MKKIVIFGDNPIAKMLFDDLSQHRSNEFNVVAFTLDEEFIKRESFCGKPLVSFKDIERYYPPTEFDIISTIDAPSKMRNRLEVFKRIKSKGYHLPNYVSPLADVAPCVKMGENNIIMAFACVGSDGTMYNANFIRQNTYLGHDFVIGSGNTISAGCTVAGCCTIGDSCFIGIGATIIDHLVIADDTLVGAGAVLIKSTEQSTKYVGNPAKAIAKHGDTGVMIDMRNRDN